MKHILKTITAIVFVIAFSQHSVYGQPPPGNQVPLDPFSWTILGAGAAIAGKKYYDTRKHRGKDKF